MPMDAFETLADPGFARDAATILSGYGAAAGVDLATEQLIDRDIPNEVSGLLVVVGAEYAPRVDGSTKRFAQLGAGSYAGLAFADRIGIRESVEGAL